MNNYAHFDRSTFPLIVVRFSGVRETDENFAAYLDGLYENYNSKKPFALVFDATEAANPNLKYQQRQAKWMKTHEALIKEYCLGVAYVMPNTLLRIALRLIFGIQNNPVPFKVFAKLEDGKNWAEELIAPLKEVSQQFLSP